MIVALQSDPLNHLDLSSDSSLSLAYEAQRRGFKVFSYTPKDLTFDGETLFATGYYIHLLEEGTSYTLQEKQVLNLATSDFLLIRQDPPFDQRYLANLYLLELLETKVKMVNSPKGIRAACEKTLPLFFPEYIPPTCISENPEALFSFSSRHDAVVIKPLFGHGGNGVLKLERPTVFSLQTLQTLYHTSFPGPLVMQAYLPEVIEGDKRILLVGGDPVAVFKRVPQQGDIRSNLVQGGTAQPCVLSDGDKAVCTALKPKLLELGLYLVGVDMIGDYLMEINVTSPTGLRMAKKLYDMDIAKIFWDGLLRMV